MVKLLKFKNINKGNKVRFFEGKINRVQFLTYSLFWFLILIFYSRFIENVYLKMALNLVFVYINVTLLVKRSHDFNRSGKWFVGVYLLFWLLVFVKSSLGIWVAIEIDSNISTLIEFVNPEGWYYKFSQILLYILAAVGIVGIANFFILLFKKGTE